MRKLIYVLLIFSLILGLFAACFSYTRQANELVQQLSQLETFTFTAEGELRFADGIDTGHTPLRYVMEGTRSVGTGQLTATITYTDLAARPLFPLAIIETGGVAYAQFAPLFQYLMDLEYADYDANAVADAFGGSPYLALPSLDLTNLLLDIPALLDTLDADTLQDALTEDNDVYTLRLTGTTLSNAPSLGELTRPLGIFFELGALVGDFDSSFMTSGAPYTLHLRFSHDEETDVFHTHLTLTAPGFLTLTASVTYRESKPVPILPPELTVDMAEIQSVMAEYHVDMERVAMIEGSDFEFDTDLPELHMVNHPLSTDLLEPFEMEIGGESFYVSVMADAVTTAMRSSVYSVSSAMTLHYTALEARAARETMIPFILTALDVEDIDAENFTRSVVRGNAHDTAAVTALHFDDNLVGRVLHLYVLQNIDGTDEALFLRVVVIMDHMTRQGREVLERLGFYIGLDFEGYLEWAEETDTEAEEE